MESKGCVRSICNETDPMMPVLRFYNDQQQKWQFLLFRKIIEEWNGRSGACTPAVCFILRDWRQQAKWFRGTHVQRTSWKIKLSVFIGAVFCQIYSYSSANNSFCCPGKIEHPANVIQLKFLQFVWARIRTYLIRWQYTDRLRLKLVPHL